MKSLTLHWVKDYLFYPQFNTNILDDPRLTQESKLGFDTYEFPIRGVYIIFAGIYNDTTVYVGSGSIKNRFSDHMKHLKDWTKKYGTLYATWADTTLPILLNSKLNNTIDTGDTLQGIEKFVGILLDPKETQRLPQSVDSVLVNLPVWKQPEKTFMTLGSQLKPNPFLS